MGVGSGGYTVVVNPIVGNIMSTIDAIHAVTEAMSVV
jgi:hypothetical protein